MGLPERGAKGGEYFDFTTVCNEGAVLVFKIREIQEETILGENKVRPVVADVLVLDKSRAGTLVEGERIINAGIADPLRKSNVGAEVVRKMGWGEKPGRKPFVVGNYPSDEEYALAESAYAATANDPWTAAKRAQNPVGPSRGEPAPAQSAPAQEPAPAQSAVATEERPAQSLPASAPWLNKG